MISTVNLSIWNPKLLSFGQSKTGKIDKGYVNIPYDVIPVNYENEEMRLKLPETYFEFGFLQCGEHNIPPSTKLYLTGPLLDVFRDISDLYEVIVTGENHAPLIRTSSNCTIPYARCRYKKQINPLIIDADTGNDISINRLMGRGFWAIPVLRFTIFSMNRSSIGCDFTELKVTKKD